MSKTFKQGQWGTVRGVSMAAAGCGPSSLASIIYNKDTSITPAKVATWMYDNGYWSSAGSTRVGVTKALAHYGFQCLYFTPERTGNAEWKTAMELIKATRDGKCWAILMVVGTKNGGKDNYWTTGGHLISVTDYDPSTGKVYVRDPGARNRTGYHSPSELIYDCNAIWLTCMTY